ncbi:DUF268 domain-containing protein [Brachyspira intermedia]|uniref:DUF268 domain-containing protein n=1 Tax=Brachyspira intermedia TaxID=84377 RepID=UPI0030066DF9
MKSDTINRIVWFIPFKWLRNSIRNKLLYIEKIKWINNCEKIYNKLNTSNRFKIESKNNWYILSDNTESTPFDTHYLYHVAWASRCLSIINPKKHIDISSSLNFSTISSAFIDIDFYDYRPANIYNLSGFNSLKANLTKLHFEDNSIESISCMHVIEHIGLGRYGDEIDPNGDIKAINELKRVIKKHGYILFVVPIGKPRLQFNAHRIYSYDMIINYFNTFELINYSLIPDNAYEVGIINNASKELTDKQNYGCGCFLFKK